MSGGLPQTEPGRGGEDPRWLSGAGGAGKAEGGDRRVWPTAGGGVTPAATGGRCTCQAGAGETGHSSSQEAERSPGVEAEAAGEGAAGEAPPVDRAAPSVDTHRHHPHSQAAVHLTAITT
ncbi:uncharacterized protein LOC143297082 [Babylonia areolata]|uniref:uncharacterized protein LOC143297082 n=1 Tax=Babylonia areolata TaxID=304850 RepID=UPI003FD4802F